MTVFASSRAASAIGAALALAGCAPSDPAADIAEFAIAYPDRGIAPRNGCPPQPEGPVHPGSTHEIVFDHRRGGDLWISGQNYDRLVRVTPASGAMRFVDMPEGSGPHGLEFDAAGRLWATLECQGRLVALDGSGRMTPGGEISLPAGTRPHGLGVGADGRTIWYTGKTTGTLGRVAPDGTVTSFPLADPTSTPIYIRLGPDGNMWATELTGNRIARVTPDGRIAEFPIPTANSRPIAIVPGPDGAMWFSEEAGSKIGRIDRDGGIVEFAVPRSEANLLLAGLAFDRDGNLWVQQYVDHNHPEPTGADGLVRIDKAGLAAGPAGLKESHFTFYPVPTRDTVMHRVIAGPDGAIWFTEMHADKLGRLAPRARE